MHRTAVRARGACDTISARDQGDASAPRSLNDLVAGCTVTLSTVVFSELRCTDERYKRSRGEGAFISPLINDSVGPYDWYEHVGEGVFITPPH